MELLARIDLDRIRQNLNEIKSTANADVLLMVKADAYGHGMLPIAHALESDVAYLGVANLEEGELLRKSGISVPILVACTFAHEFERAFRLGLDVALTGNSQLEPLISLAQQGKCPRIHIKINTGMNRFGIDCDSTESMREELVKLPVVGCYTHLRTPNRAQLDRFDRQIEGLKECFPSLLCHSCSSSSISLNRGYEMVRIGIAAYDRAMSVYGHVIGARKLSAGDHIGYGEVTLKSDTNVAWAFGGYADGISRENPQEVILRDRKCRVIAVCMDAFCFETGNLNASIGEVVILQNEELTASRVAENCGTIPYTVLCGRHGRYKREYYDKGRSQKECACEYSENECGGV